MAPKNDATPNPDGPELWRSLDELCDTEEFRKHLHNEFPEDATEWTDPVTRRKFLQLSGASLALAGVAGVGCSPRPAPNRKIVPFVEQPERMSLGNPLFFATALTLAGDAVGVIAKSREGRPIKIEGNPKHPASRGGTDVFAQAQILSMYDPDRSGRVTRDGAPSTWEQAKDALQDAVKATGDGTGLRLLTETVCSPTLIDQIEKLLKAYPEAKWVQYEPVNRDNVHAATAATFGKPYVPVYHFAEADVVLSLEADFLSSGPGSVRHAAEFMSRRKVRQEPEKYGKDQPYRKDAPAYMDRYNQAVGVKEMSRLYAVESMPTPTGNVADHRLPLAPAKLEAFAQALAAELGVAGAPEGVKLSGTAEEWIKPLAADLKKAGNKAVVLAGEHCPASLHALVAAINDALGAPGTTVEYIDPTTAQADKNQTEELGKLVEEMAAGDVKVMVTLSANPAYTAPSDLNFAEAYQSEELPFRFHLGLYVDETAGRSHWHVPQAHELEAWGDARSCDGSCALQQPLIEPVFNGHTALEIVNTMLSVKEQVGVQSEWDLVREHWRGYWSEKGVDKPFEEFWHYALHDGVIDGPGPEKKTPELGEWKKLVKPARFGGGSGIEVAIRPDPTIHDGRFANNGWLQELPKPVSKVTWDNCCYMSAKTAKDLGVEVNPGDTAGERGRGEVDVVEVNLGDKIVVAPVWILPGHPDECVTVHLGYGRMVYSRYTPDDYVWWQVGNNIGFNAYNLRTAEKPWGDTGAAVTRTGDEMLIGCVQMYSNMEGRRPARRGDQADYINKEFAFARTPSAAAGEIGLIRENTPLAQYKAAKEAREHDHEEDDHGHDHDHGGHDGHGEHGEHGHHDGRLVPLTLYTDMNHYPVQRRWSMNIDLSACTGCNVCMIACQAENNIPIVGKDEVTRGREMHWIRVDRYYKGDPMVPESIETFVQPVACVQCEKAPCEVVCPVGATVHSADGLNDMVYNRCVGTRYCSNNCPYKVRRFNFLSYADYRTESFKLGRNPEVTVRSRGVMEKCTYCAQRIRAAEIVAEREYAAGERKTWKIEDGEIVTACQAACPTAAITFGDLADDGSTVQRLKEEPTDYGLLEELNTMPRTTYLAAVHNPNPDMPTMKQQEGA